MIVIMWSIEPAGSWFFSFPISFFYLGIKFHGGQGACNLMKVAMEDGWIAVMLLAGHQALWSVDVAVLPQAA